MNTTNPLNPARCAAVTRKRREAGRKAAAKTRRSRRAIACAPRCVTPARSLRSPTRLRTARRLVASQSLTRCLTTSVAISQRQPPRALRRANLPTNRK